MSDTTPNRTKDLPEQLDDTPAWARDLSAKLDKVLAELERMNAAGPQAQTGAADAPDILRLPLQLGYRRRRLALLYPSGGREPCIASRKAGASLVQREPRRRQIRRALSEVSPRGTP